MCMSSCAHLRAENKSTILDPSGTHFYFDKNYNVRAAMRSFCISNLELQNSETHSINDPCFLVRLQAFHKLRIASHCVHAVAASKCVLHPQEVLLRSKSLSK